jgi:hypothetical protein
VARRKGRAKTRLGCRADSDRANTGPTSFAVVTVIWFASLASSRASAQDWVWQRPRSPGPLLEAEAAYDSVRQRTVMFGGLPLNCQLCAEFHNAQVFAGREDLRVVESHES